MTADKYIYYEIVVSVVLMVKQKSCSHYTVYRKAVASDGSIRSKKNPPKGQSSAVDEGRRCVISNVVALHWVYSFLV